MSLATNRSGLQPSTAWLSLFASSHNSSEDRNFTALARHGEDFLFLPAHRQTAPRAIQLYPAQTWKARFARAIVQSLITLGLSEFLPQRTYRLTADSPFAIFLQSFVPGSTLPTFAVLVGNPNTPGPRFIFLVFDETGRPACVVKAGLAPEARELIRREHRFLEENSREFPHLPAPMGFSENSDYTAFTLPFVEGRSPALNDATGPATLLRSWCRDADTLALDSIPAWQALDTEEPRFQDIASLRVKPVLMHGDFAPWNLRVGREGVWIALDWERGEFPGVPGWDWFHYEIQTSILVRKESAPKTLERLRSAIASEAFRAYSAYTGIQSHEIPLLIAYLHHACQLRQTEGARQLETLLATVISQTR